MPLQVLVHPIITHQSTNRQGLDIVITVWNNGGAFALLEEMSCSWNESYRFDYPGIGFQGWACGKNIFIRRVLAPNEKVTHQKVSLYFSKPQPQEIIFRVGLVQPVQNIKQADLVQAYRSTSHRYLGTEASRKEGQTPSQTVWSNAIRVRARVRWQS